MGHSGNKNPGWESVGKVRDCVVLLYGCPTHAPVTFPLLQTCFGMCQDLSASVEEFPWGSQGTWLGFFRAVALCCCCSAFLHGHTVTWQRGPGMLARWERYGSSTFSAPLAVIYSAPSILLPSALFSPGLSRKFRYETFTLRILSVSPLPETFFPFMCKVKRKRRKKKILVLVVIKINHGRRADKLFIEIPFFQGFCLYSSIAHEYKTGSIHPKPQENTSG